MQIIVKHLKDVGIDAKVDQKEYGAYISTCFYGKFPSMTYGPQTPFLEPDNFLFGQYYPGRAQEPEPHQRSRWWPTCSCASAARSTSPSGARSSTRSSATWPSSSTTCRCPSAVYVAVWEGALKNYGPNLGYDYGGRLLAAWLDR